MGMRKKGEENNDRETDQFGCNEVMAKDKFTSVNVIFCKQISKRNVKKQEGWG